MKMHFTISSSVALKVGEQFLEGFGDFTWDLKEMHSRLKQVRRICLIFPFPSLPHTFHLFPGISAETLLYALVYIKSRHW